MVVFVLTGVYFIHCGGEGSIICVWKKMVGVYTLPYLLLVNVFLITIFITDFEKKLILDKFVFIPFIISLFLIILFNPDYSYANLFFSFASASFFLIIHLLTKGKGMGLGDVKLVLLPPLILGWPHTIIWLFLSFIIGAGVGVLLIFLGKAKLGKHIPFGPFLIFSYFLAIFWGDKLFFLIKFALP
jgi:prepilin signal peptidase PulO-like enzyme (type II secretory pathway)